MRESEQLPDNGLGRRGVADAVVVTGSLDGDGPVAAHGHTLRPRPADGDRQREQAAGRDGGRDDTIRTAGTITAALQQNR